MASPGYGLWVIGYGLRASLLLLTYYPSPYAPCLSKSAIRNLSSVVCPLSFSPRLRLARLVFTTHMGQSSWLLQQKTGSPLVDSPLSRIETVPGWALPRHGTELGRVD